MKNMLSSISSKLARANEALGLIINNAADFKTRRHLVQIYRSLGNPALYSQEFDLSLRINRQIFATRIRIEDIFVLAEILRERQYALTVPLPKDAFIIDAGANIGISTLWFLAQSPTSTVHCFEPGSQNFRLLASNLDSDPRVQLFQAALGKETGTIDLHLGDFGAVHSVIDASVSTGGKTETVPMTTLADHLEAHSIARVDLLKLDVEGSELDALIGLGVRIGDIRMIIGEMHENLVDARDFYNFLEHSGFQISQKRHFRDSKTLGVHGFEAIRSS